MNVLDEYCITASIDFDVTIISLPSGSRRRDRLVYSVDQVFDICIQQPKPHLQVIQTKITKKNMPVPQWSD